MYFKNNSNILRGVFTDIKTNETEDKYIYDLLGYKLEDNMFNNIEKLLLEREYLLHPFPKELEKITKNTESTMAYSHLLENATNIYFKPSTIQNLALMIYSTDTKEVPLGISEAELNLLAEQKPFIEGHSSNYFKNEYKKNVDKISEVLREKDFVIIDI